ncbi:hypothetical protein B0H10DRAFT_2225995 [Mycena sp. CBHHK59/15]|nr:hypothetical protein B0H10DRAFT_2225995 [Mycena sp. CBHHK59/15]
MASSSLSSVVSNLVRASMGTTTSTSLNMVSDADLDKAVADLILKEAKKKAERFGQDGIRAYLRSGMSESNAPRTNKRFLSSIIRSTDDHNKTILQAQALAAQELKREKDEAERRERRARAEEAAKAAVGERMTARAGTDGTDELRNGPSGSKELGRLGWATRTTRNTSETSTAAGKDHGRGTVTAGEMAIPAGSVLGTTTGPRSTEESRVLTLEGTVLVDDDLTTKPHHVHTGAHDVGHPVDIPIPVTRKIRSAAAADPLEEAAARIIIVPSLRLPPVPFLLLEQTTLVLANGDAQSLRVTADMLPQQHPNLTTLQRARSNYEVVRPTEPPSPAPRSKRNRSTSHQPSRSPEPAPKRKKTEASSSRTRAPSRSPSRSPTPGPDPDVQLPSKMDKYFEESYDPRLDVAPLAVPKVPATGLINNAEFEGWDAMLELIRIRREDREEKKMMERLGLTKEKSKPHKSIAASGVSDRWSGEGVNIMEIEYKKRGSVREWDMGKEGF